MRKRTKKCILIYNILIITIFSLFYHSDLDKLQNLFYGKNNNNNTVSAEKQYHNTQNEPDKKKDTNTLSHIILDSVKKTNKTLKLLIIISSHVFHSNRRALIRQLWGNVTKWKNKEHWELIFVLGFVEYREAMKKVEKEALCYKDVIIEDLAENFYRLAEKVIIGITWAQRYFKFDAILKGDDDVFMNIDNIILFINTVKNRNGYYGQRMVGVPVHRFGRYKVKKEDHKNELFDPYCSGGGFIMMNASIYKTMQYLHLNKIMRIDDAHFGEMAHKAGVNAEMKSGFYMWNSKCTYYKDIMVSHPITNKKCMEYLLQQSMINSVQEENRDERSNVLDMIYLLIVTTTFMCGFVFAMYKYVSILFRN